MHLDESYVCISCLQPTSSLFQKYSEGVIRLTECKKCGGVVDKYVEYDNVLVVIDLIIHYLGAYRHVVYNMKSINYLRLSVIFLFCDAYDKWISGRALISSKKIYDLEWIFYESLVQSTIEISTYIGVIILFEYFRTKSMARVQFVSTSTMLGYYGNVAVVLSIIFRLSNELSYRAVTQLFIFISHVQVQRAIFPSTSLVFNMFVVIIATGLSIFSGLLCKNILEYI